jgi:hypothetical protein
LKPFKKFQNYAENSRRPEEHPVDILQDVVLGAAILASDAGWCWATCQFRSCRRKESCQALRFEAQQQYVACKPRWSEAQENRFQGAMHFGFAHLLPRTFTPIMPHGEKCDLEEIEKRECNGEGFNPFDVDLLVLHVPRGSDEDYEIAYEKQKPQPFWKRP